MNRKQLAARIRFALQYLPFTVNTVLLAAVAWFCYWYMHKPKPARGAEEDTDSFYMIIAIMGKVVFLFLAVLVAVSIVSTIISWLYYLWLNEKKPHKLQVSFTNEIRRNGSQRLYMQSQLEGVRRPVLGFIKGRLFYDDLQMTDKFSLLSDKKKENSFWRAAITGKSRMLLPDIKEYKLKGGFIYFEDMLRLISIGVKQPVAGHFYQPPVFVEEQEHEVFPKKTETLDVRIDQMRKVEGEPLNYKDFEAGDDVRRIVWKVYARNRELVVRMPERFEPFASHLYFYASFEASVKGQWLQDSYFKEMLNYYKNRVWTIYDTLARKEWEMRYIPDQQLSVPENLTPAEQAARIISNSRWHQDYPLSKYFNTRSGTVLCISSLTDPQELQTMLQQCDAGTIVYFVKLSRTFSHFVAWGWLQRLFFLPPKDRLARIRSSWVFSPTRAQIRKREKEIETILTSANVVSGIM